MLKLPDFRTIAGKFEPKYAWKHFLEGEADSEMSWKHEKIEQVRLSRATLEFQVKVCSKYGKTWCAKVRLEMSYNSNWWLSD